MGGGGLFQLLNPVMLAVFAAGFALIALHDRPSRRAAFLIALYHLIAAIGLTLDFFRALLPLHLGVILINLCFMGGFMALVAGVSERFGRRAPWLALTLAVAGTSLLNSWFLFLEPDIKIRALVLSLFGAIMAGLAARAAWGGRDLVDRALFILLAVYAAQFVIRPAAVLVVGDPNLTQATYHQSLYSIAFHFVIAVLCLAIGAVLFLAFILDIVRAMVLREQTDHLSGVHNRFGFEAQATALLAGRPAAAALVICDIDHFKRINDSFGHAAGDAAIRRLGEAMRAAAADGVVCGRIGGEEFAALIPLANVASARLWCEKLRALLAVEPASSLHFTVSFGVAEIAAGETLSSALDRADQALYAAKAAGRNRIVDADPASVGVPLQAA